MKKIFLLAAGLVFAVLFNSIFILKADAGFIDITDPSLPHFGDFPNVNSPDDYSNISKPFIIEGEEEDFGWHYSPSNHGSAIGGILLSPNSYAVTKLRFQVHVNPFRDFLLQGSMNTTTGFDGDWDTLLASTVTKRTELAVQEWSFGNASFYSAYRIHVLNDYTGEGSGWAMYRWELLAEENSTAPVPEPTTILLFSTGLVGAFLRKKLFNRAHRNVLPTLSCP